MSWATARATGVLALCAFNNALTSGNSSWADSDSLFPGFDDSAKLVLAVAESVDEEGSGGGDATSSSWGVMGFCLRG